jgi:hypothetical protein
VYSIPARRKSPNENAPDLFWGKTIGLSSFFVIISRTIHFRRNGATVRNALRIPLHNIAF